MKQPTGEAEPAAPVENLYHQPVLTEEAVSLWMNDPDGIYIDATAGGGGHSEALLKMLSSKGRLLGIDCDPDAIAISTRRLEIYGSRVSFRLANFVEFPTLIKKEGMNQVHGILADLGVSSHQINTPSRGFSYRSEGSLDMRMHQSVTPTAGDLLNTSSLDDLIYYFRTYGEERLARRIAQAIVEIRARNPIQSTTDLAAIVRRSVPGKFAVKSLSRIFQALRIAVNQEIDHLLEFLSFAPNLLLPGGRLVIIAYHSLEDRPVKHTFRFFCGKGPLPQEIKTSALSLANTCKALTKRPIRPGQQEIAENPRARSARLRAIEKL